MPQYCNITVDRRIVLTGYGALVASYSCTGHSTTEKTGLLNRRDDCLAALGNSPVIMFGIPVFKQDSDADMENGFAKPRPNGGVLSHGVIHAPKQFRPGTIP